MGSRIDLTGQRFGRLEVVRPGPTHKSKSGFEFTRWFCLCDCGREVITYTSGLRRGHARSCGCLQKEVAAQNSITSGHKRARHGMTNARVWRIWRAMIGRCSHPATNGYERYGGRGISVCDRWNVFENFLADMGQPPDGFSIDRINNDGNYEPQNCRWASARQQRRNREKLHTTAKLTDAQVIAIRSSSRPSGELAREFGVTRSAIWHIRAGKTWRLLK